MIKVNEKKIFLYSYILTKWHVDNLSSILNELLEGKIKKKDSLKLVKKSIDLVLNKIFADCEEIHSSISVSLNKYLSISFYMDADKDKVCYIYDSIAKNEIFKDKVKCVFNQNESKIILCFKKIKKVVGFKSLVMDLVLKSLPIILLTVYFYLSNIFKYRLNISIILILLLLNFLIIILLNNFTYDKNIGKNVKLNLEEKINLLYSIYLTKQKLNLNSNNILYLYNQIKTIQDEISVKSNEIKNSILMELACLDESRILIDRIQVKNSDNNESIKTTNEKFSSGSKAIANLTSNIATNIDNELKNSSNTVDRIKNSVKILEESLNVADVLNRNSEYIFEFMKTIIDISSKIHILSMNASITAARYGDRGKPFMVIAKEIRKLSEDVRSSVEEIKKKSGDLKKSINEFISLVGNVDKEIETTYTDISNILERIGGVYLSLNVIEKKIQSNTKEFDKLVNLINLKISEDNNNYNMFTNNLKKINLNSINQYVDFVSSEVDKINLNSMNILKNSGDD